VFRSKPKLLRPTRHNKHLTKRIDLLITQCCSSLHHYCCHMYSCKKSEAKQQKYERHLTKRIDLPIVLCCKTPYKNTTAKLFENKQTKHSNGYGNCTRKTFEITRLSRKQKNQKEEPTNDVASTMINAYHQAQRRYTYRHFDSS